jgi:hypothetical protein
MRYAEPDQDYRGISLFIFEANLDWWDDLTLYSRLIPYYNNFTISILYLATSKM